MSERVKLRSDMLQVVRDQHQLLQDWACQSERRYMQQMDDQFRGFATLVGELRDELRSRGRLGENGDGNGADAKGGVGISLYEKKVAELARSANSIGAGLYMPPYKLEAMGSVSDAGSLSDPRPNRLMTSEDSEDRSQRMTYCKSSTRSHLPILKTDNNPHLDRFRMKQEKSKRILKRKDKQAKIAATRDTTDEATWVQLVEKAYFKWGISFAIFLNTMFMGFEVDQDMKLALEYPPADVPEFYAWFNRLFALLFTIELALRIFAYRWQFFDMHDENEDFGWNVLDTLLVVSSWVEEVLQGANMTSIRIMRLMKVVRTLRIVRVIHFFRSLRMMVFCILNSLVSLAWALILLVMTMYLFAIVCVQAAVTYLRVEDRHSMPPEGSPWADDLDDLGLREALEVHFRSISRALFSMLMAVSGGVDWYDVCRPLLQMSPVYALMFCCYIVFVIFGMLNVLNAVFIDQALQIRDRDLMINAHTDSTDGFLRDMQELFREAAPSRDDKKLTRKELTTYLKNDRVMSYMAGHQLDVSDVDCMFNLLDVDRSGLIDESEFILGTLRLKGQARCLDVLRMFLCFDRITSQVANIENALGIACDPMEGPRDEEDDPGGPVPDSPGLEPGQEGRESRL